MQPITLTEKSRRGARGVNCVQHPAPIALEEVDIDTGWRMDADIYLTKPLDLSALVVQVSTLLEEERRDG